jgi:hypothetical protein
MTAQMTGGNPKTTGVYYDDEYNHALWDHPATGVTYSGGSRTLPHSGLRQIYGGQAAAKYFGVASSDPNRPDVWGVVHVGVVYTTGTKIAEHGGANPKTAMSQSSFMGRG